ncbi:MAG: PDZ domain-containing protein, partial [Bacteroidaceae bacterium]|nr:PDZ domain-containing protein [Bacteroidaceae bacterium]
TKDATSKIDMSNLPHVFYHTQAGGISGASDNITLRANSFSMTDTLSNLVVDCSLNEKGALASSEYVGLIGTKILSLYNIIFSPQEQAVYLKRICDHKKYSKGSTLQMAYFDRTDICEGWIVNGLFKDGIAEKAGIEIGDIIIAINGRHVKEITWEEQMNMELKGKTIFLIKKTDGSMKEYTLNIDKEII